MVKMQFQEKQHTALSTRRLIGAVVALIAFFLLLTSVISLAEKHFAIKSRIKELRAEEIALREKEQTLVALNAYLETPEGKEQVLREKYNLVKPGEGMVIVTQTKAAAPETDKKGIVSKWWDAILRGLGMREE
jgi:cell division protein FtsB